MAGGAALEGAFLTPAKVATRLKVSRATIYGLVERGELVAQRIGLALRIWRHDLEVFLARR